MSHGGYRGAGAFADVGGIQYYWILCDPLWVPQSYDFIGFLIDLWFMAFKPQQP